ncbi:piggyBac transposable element-derived protein 4-like [Anomaloglossus baeobatrachus]
MDKDRDETAKGILQLTLEILFWLTGEDYTIVKKPSSEWCQTSVPEEWVRTLSTMIGLPPHRPIHEDINEQKILELAYKIIELLSSKKTTPERCPHPLLPEDCSEEYHGVPQDDQGKDLNCINNTETYAERWKVEPPTEPNTDNPPDDCTRSLDGHQRFSCFTADEHDITPNIFERQVIIPDTPPDLHSKDLSSDPFQQVLSSTSSKTKMQNKRQRKTDEQELADKVESSFSCLECGKCFTEKPNLIRHQRSHTGDKPFFCSECGKCFTEKFHLVAHQRSHTGEKPFSSSECTESFTEQSQSQRVYSAEEAYAPEADSEREDPTFLYSSHSSSSSDTDSPPRRRRRTRDCPEPEAMEEDPQPSASNPQPSASHAQPSTNAPVWTPVPENFAPQIPDFVPQSGIQFETANLREIDFFKVYFSESIVSLMVEQTNLYAQQFLAENPNSSCSTWSPIDSVEMMKYWGLVLNMGIVKKPEIRQYWSTDILDQTPIFGMVMTRKRFEAIHKFLHFRDNADSLPCDDTNFDRLFKIRPVIEHFSNKFAEVYIPQREICVDESLIHFKGRLQFSQYLPSKTARYRIKLYKLCESTSGYTHSFKVYQGKDSRIQPPECPPALGVSGKIVWDLIHPLLDKGYHLYVDNFYTSIPLFQSLSARTTAACGTVRRNQRGLPLSLIEQPLPKGESQAQCSGNMVVVKFKNKSDSFFLTTIHGPGTTATTVRGTPAQVYKLDCALEYHKHMGGVNLSDQVLQPYGAMRKAKVWYKKLAVHIVQMAMYNAYVLSRCAGQTNNSSFLQFQEAVIKALMFGDEEGAGPSTSRTQVSRMVPGQHFACEARLRKRCRVCYKKGRRRETRFQCETCPDKPGLCLNECFRIHHMSVD